MDDVRNEAAFVNWSLRYLRQALRFAHVGQAELQAEGRTLLWLARREWTPADGDWLLFAARRLQAGMRDYLGFEHGCATYRTDYWGRLATLGETTVAYEDRYFAEAADDGAWDAFEATVCDRWPADAPLLLAVLQARHVGDSARATCRALGVSENRATTAVRQLQRLWREAAA